MSGQSTQQQNNNVNTGGWAPSLGSLTNALTDANSAYTNSVNGSNSTTPSGFVAGLTPDQIANFQQMIGYGGNTAPATGTINAGGTATNSGLSDSQTALNALLGFNPGANLNPSSIVNGANALVQGYNIPAEVQNAMQGAEETARDVTLPGIDSMAAGTGNTNSSRAGIASGLVERGLAEQAGNLTGTLENQAYGNSLGLASNNANNVNSQYLQTLLGAGGLGSTLFGQGVGATSTGIGDLASTLGLGAAGGAGLQQGNQLGLNNQIAQNQYATQQPFAPVDQLMPLVLGAANTGQSGTTTSTQTTNPSFLSTLGGLLGAGGSLLGGQSANGSSSGVLGLLGALGKLG